MALDTYADLKTSVLGWLARPGDPLVEPAVPDMIRLFEAEANRRLRTVDAERYVGLPVTSAPSREFVVLPSDCWQIRDVSWAGNQQLQYLPPGGGYGLWGQPGTPRYYSLYGQNSGGLSGQSGIWTEFYLRLAPAPDQDGSIDLVYQVGVPPLSDSRPSNWLFGSHADAYLFGTMAEAELYIGHDERATLWLQRRDAVLASIEAFDRKTRWAGPMQVRVDGITSPTGGGGGGAAATEPITITEIRVINPLSGQMVAMVQGERALYVEGGPREALTILLPPMPSADMPVEISFANPVTTLTMADSVGTALATPDSAYGPGAGLHFRFVDDVWRYWK